MSQFASEQKVVAIRIFKVFEVYLPAGPLPARLVLIEVHVDSPGSVDLS